MYRDENHTITEHMRTPNQAYTHTSVVQNHKSEAFLTVIDLQYFTAVIITDPSWPHVNLTLRSLLSTERVRLCYVIVSTESVCFCVSRQSFLMCIGRRVANILVMICN